MSDLERSGNQITMNIPISTDEQGYLGRECPLSECEGYFKILIGTGLKGIEDCYCPYCGHHDDQRNFTTKDQIEYAKSIAFRQVTDSLEKDLKKLEFETKPKGPFGIGISMKVKSGRPYPIHAYKEKQLEKYFECPNCTLKYAVYGVFAFCPDCGQHNSLQILHANMEIIRKMIEMASLSAPDVAEKLIENALEDCISSFDGFGREVCRINNCKAKIPNKTLKISFQSLYGANGNIQQSFGFSLENEIDNEEWKSANISFQKRHLLTHKMGIIDDEYVRRSGDSSAIVGRKIIVTADEVLKLIPTIEKLAESMIYSMESLGEVE